MRNTLHHFPLEKHKRIVYNILSFLRQALMDSVKACLSLGSETPLMSNSFFISSWMKRLGNDSPWPHEAYVIDFVPLFQAASLRFVHLGALTANTSCGLWKGYIKIIIYYSHSAKGSH